MNALNILADENIPGLELLCGHWASIKTRPGREICATDLIDIDILFVRSVTAVNSALLQNSNVSFVGSATIGTDHIDIDYLENAGIKYAHAPGSNANAVVDYVMSCIARYYHYDELFNETVGIIGAGNVGRRLANCLDHFNINFVIYDPFVSLKIPQQVNDLDDIFNCNIVSLHVPLTVDSDHSTMHFFDHDELRKLNDNCLLVNTSRGAVINNKSLLSCINNGQSLNLALDVWENEPNISWDLCRRADISTPHIAGYSYPGKIRGAEQIVTAAQLFFGIKQCTISTENLVSVSDFTSLEDFFIALAEIYQVRHDHDLFKHNLELSSEPAQCFDNYRKNYSHRNEINYEPL